MWKTDTDDAGTQESTEINKMINFRLYIYII